MPYTVVQFDPACIITVSRSLYTPPPTTCTHSDIPSSLPVGREGVDGGGGEVGVAFESFTQPSRYDELVISTQVPCTPGATEVLCGECSKHPLELKHGGGYIHSKYTGLQDTSITMIV
jgi:hypothetical protein